MFSRVFIDFYGWKACANAAKTQSHVTCLPVLALGCILMFKPIHWGYVYIFTSILSQSKLIFPPWSSLLPAAPEDVSKACGYLEAMLVGGGCPGECYETFVVVYFL